MPATPLRGGLSSVDYVVVRRDGLDGDDESNDYDQTNDVTNTVTKIIQRTESRQLSSRDDDDYNSDSDDDEAPPPGAPPPPILFTMTLTGASSKATGQALADTDPTETVVVSIPPPPKPERESGRISQTTEHLLIAAGSIGATIVVVMLVLGFYMMRKRGYSLGDAFKEAKYRTTGRGAPPPPPKNSQGAWDSKKQYGDDYGSMRNDSVHAPMPTAAIARSGSLSSQRPAMALGRSDSFNRTGSPNNVPGSFLLQDPPSRNNSHRRNNSGTPSSPVLPVQTHRQSTSTRNTRSIDDDASELQYSDPPQERPLSRLPPPPTFKQFLSNRPSISQRQGGGGPMISRFSWTNSNAPQTPHDPTRDTNSQIGRDSFMTSRSSVPRFRTIDSWVNQQTNRLEEQKLKDQFRLTQASTVYSEDDERAVPEVPDIPKNVTGLATPPPPPRGLPGRNIKHERHDTRTTVETAPIFRQHPGTEVRFSTRSVVPSEILDMGRKNTVLS